MSNCLLSTLGAKLSSAKLSSAKFSGAKLSIAKLSGATLFGTKMSSAKLSYNPKKGIGHFYESGYCICEDGLFANFALRGLFYKILYLSVSLNFN